MIKSKIITKITIIIGILVIIVSSTQIYNYNPNYRSSFLLIFVLLNFLLVHLVKFSKELFAIYLSSFIILIYVLLGLGDNKLLITFKMLLYSWPFYILGYCTAKFNLVKYRNYFINLIFLFYGFLVVNALLSKGIDALSEVSRTTLASSIVGAEDVDIRAVVLFWPMVFFVLNIGAFNILTQKNSFIYKLIGIILSFLMIVGIVLSTFTAVVVLLLISIVLYIIFYFYSLLKDTKISSSKKLIFTFLLITFSGILIYSFQYILSGNLGDIGGTKDELNSLIFDVDINNQSWIDKATNGRWKHLLSSFNGFLNSPIIGNGAYFYGDYTGGHSFIFDTLSWFGLIGGIPIFCIYLFFIYNGYKVFKVNNINMPKKERFLSLAFFIGVLSIFLTSILNPYLMHSQLDYLIFYFGGYFYYQKIKYCV